MFRNFAIILALLITMGSCSNSSIPVKDRADTGSIAISVDECFKPVIEEQIKVYMSRYPGTQINATYKPEAECFKDFFEDTTRVIFVTRELSQEEKDYALSKKMYTSSKALAMDAVAFIVSKDAARSEFSIKQIKEILTGDKKRGDFKIVFDNENSSTVRYVTDSLIPGEKISDNNFAAKNPEDLIDYVSKNPKAIGVIGVNWISDHTDEKALKFLDKIQVCGILREGGNAYVKPYQAYIGLKDSLGRREYPATRNLYFISKESWVGLGSGLVTFMAKDGQLLFKQARLFPLHRSILLKQTLIK